MREDKYTYEATVNPFYSCNYNCSYCISRERLLPPGRGWSREGLEKIVAFFNQRPETWRIILVGGEVTINPHFIWLCEQLTQRHGIDLVTNNSISFEKQEAFLAAVNNERIVRITCSLQSVDEEPERFEKFVQKIKKYQEHGIPVRVSYVATPERIGKLQEYHSFFEKNNITFLVQPLIGTHAGKEYPMQYDKEEYRILDETIVSARLRAAIDGVASVFGKTCAKGHTQIVVNGDTGDIFGCNLDQLPVGNIYSGELSLLPAPRNCIYNKCLCETEPATMEIRALDRKEERKYENKPHLHYDHEIYKQIRKASAPLENPERNFTEEEIAKLRLNDSFEKAKAAILAQKYLEGVELLRPFSSSEDNSSDFFYFYAVALVGSSDPANYAEAERFFAKALEKNYSEYWVCFQRGSLYIKMNRFDLAILDFEKACALDSTQGTAAGLPGLINELKAII